jgi:hypothetical protein
MGEGRCPPVSGKMSHKLNSEFVGRDLSGYALQGGAKLKREIGIKLENIFPTFFSLHRYKTEDHRRSLKIKSSRIFFGFLKIWWKRI